LAEKPQNQLLFHLIESILGKNLEDKIFTSIATLEKTNEELLNTLKQCVRLLAAFKSSGPDRQRYQDLLDTFEGAIKAGEKLPTDKTLH